MDKVKFAFETLPHVQVLYVNPDGEYYLAPREGYEEVKREDFMGGTNAPKDKEDPVITDSPKGGKPKR